MQRHATSELRATALKTFLRLVLLIFAVVAFAPLWVIPWIWLDGDPRSVVLQLSAMTALMFGSGAFLVNAAVTGRFRVAWFVGPAALAFVVTATAALLTPRQPQIDIKAELERLV